jgi:hypothetical protein
MDARRAVQTEEKEVSQRHTDTDYQGTLQRMYTALGGINVEAQTSAYDLAAKLDVSPSAVGRIRTFAERIGGMRIRYVADKVIPGRGVSGRRAMWMFVHTPDWMLTQARDQWGFTAFDNHNIEKRMPRQKDSGGVWIIPGDKKAAAPAAHSTGGAKRADGSEYMAAVTTPKETETQIQRELRKVRKNDAEALVEAIRQYMGRESFIAEELKRFAEMGIEIDPSAIKFEPNAAYETAIPLIELIDRLRAANERQGDLLNQRQSKAVDPQVLVDLKNEVEGLKEDRRKQRDAVEGLRAEYRVKTQAADRRIKELEGLLRVEATKNLQQAASA